MAGIMRVEDWKTRAGFLDSAEATELLPGQKESSFAMPA